MRIILGSQSPRRAEILSYFALPFVQIPSDFHEDGVPFAGDPRAYASHLSESKAHTLAKKFPDDIILCADTIVYHDSKVFNKPKDHNEAVRFLSELAGNWHQVFTAVTVQKNTVVYTEVEETRILFNALSSQEIERYLSYCNYLDKAGGYAIQQGGSLIVSRIEGCYYNVMGLPVNTTVRLLSKMGVNIWDYLKKF